MKTKRNLFAHLAITLCMSAAPAVAASVYWDTNSTTAASGNANGNWDTTTASWGDSAGTAATVAWNNASNDTAVFAAGTDFTGTRTVTASGSLNLSGLVVESEVTNLTITGGTLEFGAVAGSINTSAWGTSNNKTLTISSVINGTAGLSIASNGDATSANGGGNASITKLSGVNTFTGDVTITSGLVAYAADSAFGGPTNAIILNGGGLLDPNLNQALSRNIEVQSGGGTFRLYGAATATWNGVVSGTGAINRTDGGTLTLAGNNTFSGTYNNLGGTTVFSGTNVQATYNATGGVIQIGSGATGSLASTSSLAIGASGSVSVKRSDAGINSSAVLPVSANISFAGVDSRLEYNPSSASAAMTLDQDIGTATTKGVLRVSGGTLTLASGTDVVTNQISIGLQDATNRGTLVIPSGSTVTTQFVNIGTDGSNSGTIDQTGGTVTIESGGNGFRLGHWSNGSNPGSNYNLTGGALDATALSANASASAKVVNIGWDGLAGMTVGGGASIATLKSYGIQLDANGDGTGLNDTLTVSTNGVVEVGSGGIAGTSSAGDQVILNQGTLKSTASSIWSAPMTANAATSTTFDANGTTITLSNNILGTGTVVLGDTSGTPVAPYTLAPSGTQTIAANLAGSLEIIKSGTGTTTLSGAASTHSGIIYVDGGRLNLGGTSASAISVSSGKTLGGEGVTTGSLEMNGSYLAIDPNTPGYLTVGDLTFNGANTVRLDTMPTGTGPIPVMAYTGTLTGTLNTDLVLENAAKFRNATLTESGKLISVDIQKTSLVWNGAGGGQWDVLTTARWNASDADKFAWGDAVTFDDSGVTTAVTLSGELQPSSVTFAGTQNYTLTGAAGNFISGTTGVSKSGASTVVIVAPNTFTGATNINQGTIQVGNGSTSTATLGSGGTITVGTGAGLTYFNTGSSTISNPIAGSGTLTFKGPGTSANGHYVLNGSNAGFSGSFIAQSGARVQVDNSADLGTAPVAVQSGGQVFITAGTIANNFTIAGNGWLEGAGSLGALRVEGSTVSGTVTLAANSRITAYNSNGTISGNITGAYQLEAGPNASTSQVLTFSTRKDYTGGTVVSRGILDLTGGGGGSGTIRGTVTVNTGGTLRLSTVDATGYNTGSDRLSTININGGTLSVNTTNNQTLGSAAINLTGGTISGITNSNIDFFQGSSAVNSLASSTTSTVSGAKLSIRQTAGLPVTVADGAAATDLQINSVIANNGSFTTAPLVKAGAGLLELTGANTYTGATTVNAGTLSISGANGVINATSGVNISGGATVLLNNLSTANNTNRLKDAGTVSMSGGTLNFANNAGAVNYSETTGALTIAGGTNTISASQAASGQTSALTFASLTRTGGTVNFIGTGLGTDDRNKILFTGRSAGLIGPWATVNGTDLAAYDTTLGVIAYAGYFPITRLNSGTGVIPNDAAVVVKIEEGTGTARNITLTATPNNIGGIQQSTKDGSSAATIDITSGQTLRIAAAGGGVLVESGAGALTLGTAANTGSLTAGTADNTAGSLVLVNNSSNATIINSAIVNNGTGAVDFSVSGSANLTGTNTYSGTTSVAAGTLTIGSGGTTGDISGSGGTISIDATGTMVYNRSNDTTLSRVINGAGTLRKQGNGKLTVNASGGTILPTTVDVQQGTLAVTSGSFGGNRLTGSGQISVASGATLLVGAAHALGGDNGSMSEAVTLNGGTMTLNLEQYVGSLTLNGGTVNGSNQLRAPSGSNYVVGGSTPSTIACGSFALYATPTINVADVTGSSATDLTISGQVTGANGIIKSGAGTLTLTNGTNNNTGNTVVNAGTLALADNARLTFKLGATSGSTNTLTGAGTVQLDGDFAIDTTAANALTTGTWQLENVASLTGPYGSTFQVVTTAGVAWTDAGNNKWTKAGTVAGTTWTFDETTGTLTLAQAGYDSWASSYGLTGNDALRTADPDGDGFTNLQEFLFGTAPNASNGSLVSSTTSGGNLVLRWLQRNTGATYTLVQSSTLASGSWSAVASPIPGADGIQTGAPTNYTYYIVSIPIGSGKQFYQIQGVEN